MRVEIDGVQYVPRSELTEPSDSDAMKAAAELVEGFYLYGMPGQRGWVGCAKRALELLAPDVARLCEDNPEAAYARLAPDDE